MKNLKKFVALLLAGVMAMVMLTACSGGGNTGNMKEDKDAEAEILSKYSTGTNDRALKAEAEKFLDEKLNASVDIGGYGFVFDSEVKGKNDKNQTYLTVLVAAKFTYKDTLLGDILDEISKMINTDANVDIKQNGTWTDIGVVVKTNPDTKQSYMAIAFKVENPNYPKT